MSHFLFDFHIEVPSSKTVLFDYLRKHQTNLRMEKNYFKPFSLSSLLNNQYL